MSTHTVTERLATEIQRVLDATLSGSYTLADGSQPQAATETAVIEHLTSRSNYVSGRVYRFPGVGGIGFENHLRSAGFKIAHATNSRGQSCRVVVKAN